MENSNYKPIIDALRSAESIAIFIHINPDPDCMGSALALQRFLRKQGKDVYCFSPDLRTTTMMHKKLFCLPEIQSFNRGKKESYDLSVALDLGAPGRIGDTAYSMFLKGERSLVIDHHDTFVNFTDLCLREPEASSCAQILYKVLTEYDESAIDDTIAALLFAGIMTDSGNFSYESTSSETFFLTSKLKKYSFDHAELCRKLTKEETYNVFRLKNIALNDTRFFCDKKIAVIFFSNDLFMKTGTTEKDTDGIINCIQQIEDVLIGISVAEIGPHQFKISFRSKGDISAKACAETFGGGGHYNASGCRINKGDFEEVLQKLVEAAKTQLKYA